jgi:hypothetical protein
MFGFHQAVKGLTVFWFTENPFKGMQQAHQTHNMASTYSSEEHLEFQYHSFESSEALIITGKNRQKNK